MNGKTYNQQYYQANIDRMKLYAQLYYIKHKEIFKRRYIENREAIMERIKAYNKQNREKQRRYQQTYYLAINRERRKAKILGDYYYVPKSKTTIKSIARSVMVKCKDETLYVNDVEPLAIIKPYKLSSETCSPIQVKFKPVIKFD